MSNLVHQLKLDTLRSKLPSWQQTDDKSHLANSTTFAGLRTALNVVKEVAGKVGIPSLQESVRALVTVLDVLQVCLS
jgi:hypothetical protein